MRFVIGEYYLGKAIEGMSAFHPNLPSTFGPNLT
jgi:hypothetical protein